MSVIICSFNLNISPKMSYSVLESDIFMLQDYMLVFYNKKVCYLCWTLYMNSAWSARGINLRCHPWD